MAGQPMDLIDEEVTYFHHLHTQQVCIRSATHEKEAL